LSFLRPAAAVVLLQVVNAPLQNVAIEPGPASTSPGPEEAGAQSIDRA
jgi:hypothetical protein